MANLSTVLDDVRALPPGLLEAAGLYIKQLAERKSDIVHAPDPASDVLCAMKASQESLDAEWHLLRTIIDLVPDFIFVKDSEGRFITVNQQLLAVLGSDQLGDVVGRTDYDFHTQDLADKYRADDQTVLSSGKPIIAREEFHVDAQGRKRWLLTSKLPMKDGGGDVIGLVGIAHDVTERKEVEDRLRALTQALENRTMNLARANLELVETKGRLEALLNAASRASIIATDMHGVITVFNTGAEHMLQYKAKEVIGIQSPAIFHLESECAARSQALTRQYGRPVEGFEVFVCNVREGGTEVHEWTYVRKDGGTLDVKLAVSAVRNEIGETTGFVGIATDITNQKALERELRENNERLLVETQRAGEANRAKSEFLAAMSHEIRTPMNAILGMADLLSDSPLDAEQRRYVEVFRRAGQNLLELISDILDLSKIESGHFELERIEFELEGVVNRCVELIRPRIRSESVELIVDVASDLPSWLIGDPARLQQILVNLLSNAAKFTETGEIILKVERGDAAQSSRIRFSVSDSGIGIAADKLQVIFEDFTQADSSTTRKYGGTGLGLGIAKRLVRSMNGELRATSKLGEGSMFAFSATFPTSSPYETRRAATAKDFAGMRALVIDDNSTNRLIFRKYLLSWGFESSECDSVHAGLAELAEANKRQLPYAVLLLDVRMPDMDGLTAIGTLLAVASDLAIITLSSDDRPGDATKAMQLGASGYATKPVSRTDLLRLLHSAVNAKGESRASAAVAPAETTTPGVTPGRTIKVLIAEDSLDNQILVEAYLKNSPYVLKFVPNGKEAVDEFMAVRYDLILMDVQMPLLDGLTATRRIRSLEKQQGRPAIAILALSANAFDHDIAASLQAGCNAHLSKPISRTHLLDEMQKHLKAGESTDADRTQVEIPSHLKELAAGYLRRRREELVEIKKLLSKSDYDRLRTLGHNMKGAATGYGFPVLTVIGSSLESSAKKSDAEDLAVQVQNLAEYLENVRLKVVDLEPAD